MPREARKTPVRWRLWLGLALGALVSVSSAVGALKAIAYVAADPRFTLPMEPGDALTIQGVAYADRARIMAVFAPDFGRGALTAPLAERRRRLLAIDWVADATVSRVWPNHLIVRIRERKPVAFAALPSGVELIDSAGELLGIPPRTRFTFPVLDGLRADQSPAQRRAAVAAFLRLQQEMGYLSKDISEVDVSDPGDLQIVARVENHTVALILGDGDFASRYQNFVGHYDEIEKESPGASTFDLRLDDRITARK
ncbi:MAG TPA: FtsQ-type POTRA domain-containing protein [Bryobacteraceae bacterium]|nr:FtsQ-type POTRA domain-containing protein [Bryobacteraceae bacterium]